ncbi:uncharacterized protein C8A04DRAFT_12920 [Dichotomopilus funicola]|uniref:Uncharacterized protein n=1 Tax=Dichotomopilus funicola TaxID=1934379 RepID=A0AAN6ZLF5_9PEZI|nr:hypothetical protein C8A04DRAFT_12920 [Dichotomopilus funicola]
MARRTYTLSELMGYRPTQDPAAPAMAVSRNSDLADIFRRPGSDSSSTSGCRPSTSSKVKDDSSVTSDELVFKGTVNRRMGRELGRELAREATQVQNSMRASTRKTHRSDKRDIPDIATDKAPHSSRSLEWKYRGRSEAEFATTEPIPAPTGIPAQKDEGFQRFYKAVVSPTHVRVTAGGRIVPNTRGPPSPTTKRSSDNSVMDNQVATDKASASQNTQAAPPPANTSQAIPIMPQFVTGFPQGFQPIQTPVSFVPMAMGPHMPPPGFNFPQNAANLAAMGPAGPLKDTKSADGDKQGNVKPALPEPFFYNGQLMYPVAPYPGALGNHPMVPVQMVSLPHGVSPQIPQFSGQYMQPHPHPPSHPQAAHSAPIGHGLPYTPSNQSLSGIPPVENDIVPANANFNSAAAPPISSIKPSDITKKQIASFKHNLKYHEDQLLYNRHQIDEKEMEQKIMILKGHVSKFEATLQTQLEYEDAHFKSLRANEGKPPSQRSSKAADEHKALPQPPAPKMPFGYAVPATKRATNEVNNQRIHLAPYNLHHNGGATDHPMASGPMAPPAFPGVNGFHHSAGLPNGAALAPTFQPRGGYASTWSSSRYAREMKAYEEAEKRLSGTESRSMDHLRGVMTDHRSVSQPFYPPMSEESSIVGKPGSSEDSTRSNTTAAQRLQTLGVPYLLGTLPKGLDPRTARDQDYVYNRPLTDEERRARFLYWGKAPKSALRGLPKFDGKHFYPASPVKGRSVDRARGGPSPRTSERDGDPFRTVTPVPAQHSAVQAVPGSEDNCTTSRLNRVVSFESQIGEGAEGISAFNHAVNEDPNSAEANDGMAASASMRLWKAMLKKGPTSSALSPTTAQAHLPHYPRNAAASLSPSKRRENCPPGGVSSLDDQFKHLAVDVAARRDLTSGFNM